MPPPEEYDELDADGEVDGLDSSATNSTAPSQTTATAASLAAASGVGKRYRPAPAKTFQCRGYGECRMVFSRSEHLARHIRKHTGERPFTCHCGKQFSRLDNLRQHAQTVHAENPSRNEAMMRDLASVHATMTAGNGNLATTNAASPSAEETGASTTATVKRTASKKRPNTKAGGVKVKKESVEMLPSQRPGTSTGYEGAAASYPDTSGMDVDGEGEDDEDERREEVDVKPHVRSTQTQATIPRRAPHQPSPPSELGRARSFRSSQFRANSGGFRPSSASASSAAIAPGGSFRDPLPAQSSFGVGRDRESFRSHPYARRSPPELTPSPPITQNRVTSGRPFSSASTGFDGLPGSRPGTGGNGTRLPPITAFLPATGLRPGSSSSRPGSSSQSGGLSAGGILLPGSLTLRRPSTGHDWEWGDAWDVRPGTAPGKLLPSRAAPPDLDDASPFSFHVPDQPSAASAAANHGGSRKRPLGGPDGPYGPYPDDDGGKSRPASRRFSVMELCNDNQQRPPTRERERPTTTNGLISRASALVLDDRDAEHDAVFAWEAGEQHFAPADGPIAGTAPGSRPGSVRGRHAAAPGGPTAPDAWPRDERRLSGVPSLASPGASILSRTPGLEMRMEQMQMMEAAGSGYPGYQHPTGYPLPYEQPPEMGHHHPQEYPLPPDAGPHLEAVSPGSPYSQHGFHLSQQPLSPYPHYGPETVPFHPDPQHGFSSSTTVYGASTISPQDTFKLYDADLLEMNMNMTVGLRAE
ncbi:unnamed protein product [Mycena citricolor]|uniref:C2H2-type domain-containing protein n=1 Tax=Mycena citricolor TaxID=2018698 RepID=A0AAD2K461_9AGAR|nr:unnamed protein product [Mycena citricolor]CAK5277883.1 unnamed protein product [Mycena citricolor]